MKAREVAGCVRALQVGGIGGLAETCLQTGLGIREVTAARVHADSSVVSRSATAASASAATACSAAASSVSVAAAGIELRESSGEPRLRALVQAHHALSRGLENPAPLFARRVDARASAGLGGDDGQGGGVLSLEDAIDRVGNGPVWCRCRCHRRRNASQAARVSLTLVRAIQVRNQTLGPVRAR